MIEKTIAPQVAKEVEKEEEYQVTERPMEIDNTLSYVERELKYTIDYIDHELASLENKMNATNKLSAVGYQAKATLIGHRIDAAKSLAQLAMKKRDQDMRENADGKGDINDVLDLFVGGKK